MSNHFQRFWLSLAIFILLLSFIFPATPVLAQTEPPAPEGDTPAGTPTLTAATPWLDAQQSAGIVYLLYTNPPSIKRYDLTSETWLADLALSGTPTTFRVTTDTIYVGFGRRAARLHLDGSAESHLLNTTWDIGALHVYGGSILVLNCSTSLYANLITFNLNSLTQIDTKSYYVDSMYGSSFAPTIRKMFGRTIGISPSDIVQSSFSPEGLITGESDSPYHGDYPSASKTWVSPNENTVFDDSGIIYNTADLTYRSSLVGAFSDLAFYGDLPIILRGDKLIAFSNTFLETGRATPTVTPLKIFVSGDIIYGFSAGAQQPLVSKTPVSALNPATPGELVDPKGLNYTPDQVEIGSDETVYLLSKKFQSIFRWNVAQRRYLSTIPLLDVPYAFTYAASENRLYTVYTNGSIFKIDLTGDPLEKAFANLPASPCGLAMAGSYVLTCDNSGAWVTHTTFSPDGTILSKKDWNYFSREYIWSPVRQKMYFFRDDTSPNDILWEDIAANGQIGTQKDSPYHGDFSFTHPIRVKPDGSYVLIGSGLMFDALTLSRVNTLSNYINDAGWKGDSLVTLRSYNGASQLQQWTPGNFGIAKSQSVSGIPLRMFPVNEGWLAITNVSGRTRFTIWSADLTLIANAPLAEFSTSPLFGNIPLKVHFTNLSTEGPYENSLWEFGDGATSTDTNPDHFYTKSGSYTIKLTVSGSSGEDTIIKTLAMQVNPVTAGFSAPVTSGKAPLQVQFTNLTTGQYSTQLWDFGDGSTSTEMNPTHTYQELGSYTVTLTVDGPYGSSTLVRQNFIQVRVISFHYLPVLFNALPGPLLKPGTYTFSNLCQQYPLYINGTYVGQMSECVPSVNITTDGTMYFYFSWTLYKSPNVSQCVIKFSDAGNRNMYIRDSVGNRYDHTEVGGDTYINCMANGVPYTGWFKFSPATTKNTLFTFYDDDASIRMSPIILAATP